MVPLVKLLYQSFVPVFRCQQNTTDTRLLKKKKRKKKKKKKTKNKRRRRKRRGRRRRKRPLSVLVIPLRPWDD